MPEVFKSHLKKKTPRPKVPIPMHAKSQFDLSPSYINL